MHPDFFDAMRGIGAGRPLRRPGCPPPRRDSTAVADADGSSDSDAASSGTVRESEGPSLLRKYEDNNQITDAKMKGRGGGVASPFSKPAASTSSYLGLVAVGPGRPEPAQPRAGTGAGDSNRRFPGNLGARYRLSCLPDDQPLQRGVADLHAFHSEQSIDFNNPTVAYERTAFRVAGIQLLSSALRDLGDPADSPSGVVWRVPSAIGSPTSIISARAVLRVGAETGVGYNFSTGPTMRATRWTRPRGRGKQGCLGGTPGTWEGDPPQRPIFRPY